MVLTLNVSLFILAYTAILVSCDVTDLGYSADDLKECLDDCKDGFCTTSKDPYQKSHCHPFRVAPKYYTTQYRSNHKYCQSNCNYHTSGYYWCYVDSKENWDYCNAHLEVVFETKQFTKNGYGPCKTVCSYPGRDRMKCFHYLVDSHFVWDYCDNTWETYIMARDYKGKECRDKCIKRGFDTHYSCYNIRRSLETCAPPARFPTALRQLVSDLKTISNKDDKCYDASNKRRRSIAKRSKGSIPNVPEVDMEVLAWTAAARVAISMVRHMATFFERSPEYETVDVDSENNPNNAVYRYTVVPSFVPGEPVLPLAIRARITRNTIREPGTRSSSAIPSEVRRNLELMGMNRNRHDDNNDEAGHLVPWQNGGPSDTYNFAPQTRRLNRGTQNNQYLNSTSDWLRSENLINAWVRGGNGHVEQTIVVYYTDLDVSMRPIGFGTSYDLIDNNGAVRYQCYDNQFSNNPEEDGEIQENRIERTSSKRWRGSVRRIVSAAIYNLSCFTHGCSTGWVSGVLGNEALAGGAWLAALPCLVALPAAPFFAVLADARGRKAGAFCICLSFILSWSLAAWCGSRGVWTARAAAGAGGAGALALAPVYCAEIAPRTRGLAAMPALACSCGILFAYAAGGVLSAHALSISMLVPPTVLLVSLLWLPETPSFLISIGRIQDAAKVMCWFDGSDFREDLTDVIEQQEVRIRTSECYGSQRRSGLCRQESETFQPMLKRSSGLESNSDKKTEPSACKELFRHRRSRRALISICILLIVSAGSGAGAVTSFAASVLQHSAHANNASPLNVTTYNVTVYNGTSHRSLFQTSEAASMLCGTALVLGAAVATVTVDKVGRKMLLLWSCSGIACCLALLGAYCDPRLRMYSWSHIHQQWPYKYDLPHHNNTETTKHVVSNNTYDLANSNIEKIEFNGTKSWSRISIENETKSLKNMVENGISKMQIGQNMTEFHHKDEDTIWPPVILLSAVLFLYNIGLGSVPFVLMSELFCSNVRSLASSFLISFMWLSCFLLLRYFGTAVNALGLHGTYYICGSITFLGACYTCLFIPETKGKSQKQIDEALEGPLLVILRRRRKNREDP